MALVIPTIFLEIQVDSGIFYRIGMSWFFTRIKQDDFSCERLTATCPAWQQPSTSGADAA